MKETLKSKPNMSALVYGKIPPQAIELEEAILGALMLEREKLDDVLKIIRSPECFYSDSSQKIFAAVLRISSRGSMIDLLTVTEELRKSDELELIGGAYHLTKLTMTVVSSAHVEAHARIVMEKFFQREIIRICGNAISSSYDDTEDVFDILETVQGSLSNITDHIRSGNIKHLGASLTQTVAGMSEASGSLSEMLGMTTGLTKLDNITLGLTAPDLIVIAAGTGEGKTTLAVNIAMTIAEAGDAIGFFSLEMKDRQLIWKILSSYLEEDIKTVRSGKIGTQKWEQLYNKIIPSISRLPFCMYDVGGLNIIELKSIARTMKKKFKVKILFIDYIQLVRGAGKKFGTREEEVNYVSKELKSLAMELEVPIIALSQLNRIEKGTKRLYKLSDLRESGAIEQDADGVIFIYRPTEHDLMQMNIGNENMEFTETDALIDIAKWRLGETGTFRTRFDGKFNKFSDYLSPQAFAPPAFTPGINNYHSTNYSEPRQQFEEADNQPF